MGLHVDGAVGTGFDAHRTWFRSDLDEAVLLSRGVGRIPAREACWKLPGSDGRCRVAARNGAEALDTALERLATQVVTRLCVHLDVDLIDAGYARANEFPPTGGLLPEERARCVDTILGRFNVAAAGSGALRSRFDSEGFIRDLVAGFLRR